MLFKFKIFLSSLSKKMGNAPRRIELIAIAIVTPHHHLAA